MGLVADFLRRREGSCCAFSSRLLRGGRLEAPGLGQDRLLACLDKGLCLGAVIASRRGFCFAILGDAPPSGDGELGRLIPLRYRPRVLMSAPADGLRVEAALGHVALEARLNDFHFLEGPARQIVPPGGLCFRLAVPADAEALIPLQEAYEREEVTPSIHRYDPRSARASVLQSLQGQVVILAHRDGLLVGKAQTNARGESWDQLGGIYVLPAHRGQGIATAMVAELCAALRAAAPRGEGMRKLSLFVRQGNDAAARAYLKVGFRNSGLRLRIAYHA